MGHIQRKLDYITALRGLAILGVVIVHTSQYGHDVINATIKTTLQNGAMGVQLFFVASAFTLFYSYSYHIENEFNTIRNFFCDDSLELLLCIISAFFIIYFKVDWYHMFLITVLRFPV